MTKRTHGMLLGKFMPPHLGHIALANFAKAYVDDLTIVVGSLKDEPIEGNKRYNWMREMYPDTNVVHLTDENPQYPEEHPDFWNIWHDSLMRVLPCKPDYVFAGEDYGKPLAEKLGAHFIPANMGRSYIPVSATMIRENPFKHWNHIAPAARPYFLKKVSFIGAESTGKSVLAEKLAQEFETHHVPEYAYSYIKTYGKDLSTDDFKHISKGQISSETSFARQANKLLFCDTDPLMTAIWSDRILGTVDNSLLDAAKNSSYDLTLLLDCDTPWHDDKHRYAPSGRQEMTDQCEVLLKKYNRPYIKISGSWEERHTTARNIIQQKFLLS